MLKVESREKKAGEKNDVIRTPVIDGKVQDQRKVCIRCEKEKPLTSFYRCSSAPDGHQVYCKPCHDLKVVEARKKSKAKEKKRKRYREKKQAKDKVLTYREAIKVVCENKDIVKDTLYPCLFTVIVKLTGMADTSTFTASKIKQMVDKEITKVIRNG